MMKHALVFAATSTIVACATPYAEEVPGQERELERESDQVPGAVVTKAETEANDDARSTKSNGAGAGGTMYPCGAADSYTTEVPTVLGHCDYIDKPGLGCGEIGFVGDYPEASKAAYIKHDQEYCTKIPGREWKPGPCSLAKKAGGGCRTLLGNPATCQPVSTNWYPFTSFQCAEPRHTRLPPAG